MTLDALLKTPRMHGALPSPDGRWIAWTSRNIGPHGDVYIVPTDGSITPKKITDFKQNTWAVSWGPDSTSLIVSHDYEGDERDRLYMVNIADDAITPLTEEHPHYFIQGGYMHPNRSWLFYAADYDFNNEKPTEAPIIYRHDIKTGERRMLAALKKPNQLSLSLNRAGTHVLYHRSDFHPAGRQAWLVDIEGKTDREILNCGERKKVSAVWHENSEDIIFVAEGNGYKKVGVYTIKQGGIAWLVDDSLRNIAHAYNPPGAPATAAILEDKNAETASSLININSLVEIKLGAGRTTIPLIRLNEKVWVSEYYNATHPNDIVAGDSSLTGLFDHVEYKPEDLTPAEKYAWKSSDGMPIEGWLYRPKEKAIGTIVLVHGGPTAHDEDIFTVSTQFFASQGFNVFEPNYRGSTGYGLPFEEAIKKDGWGGKEQEDILEGIKALIAHGIAEPYKISVMGTSYGGYSAWHAITHFPLEYTAAVAPICGMTDLVVDYNTTRPDCRTYSEQMMGGSPSDAPQLYYDRSPINFVSNIKGKLLIVQGARDPNVSPENVAVVKKALAAHGIPFEELIFEDEGHGISQPKNQKVLLTRLVNFFRKAFE